MDADLKTRQQTDVIVARYREEQRTIDWTRADAFSQLAQSNQRMQAELAALHERPPE